MIKVESIENGIVIDHIKVGNGIKIFEYLNLSESNYAVALIMNANSKVMGKKDIIKIENGLDIEYNILSLIDSNITINVIERGEIIKKIKSKPPQKVKNVITCKNPRCISFGDMSIEKIFILNENKEYRCLYCENIYKLV